MTFLCIILLFLSNLCAIDFSDSQEQAAQNSSTPCSAGHTDFYSQNNCCHDQLTIFPSTRLLAPCRGYIAKNYYFMIPMRSNFTEALAPIFKDRKVMKYYGRGHTVSAKGLLKRFEDYERQNSEENITTYSWAVISHEGVCGVVVAYPPMIKTNKKALEISRILASSTQGKGIGAQVLLDVFEYLPCTGWIAKAHPQNIASIKSRENAGFVKFAERYDAQDKAIRFFHKRSSNDDIDGREKILFTYGSNTIFLSSLHEDTPLKNFLHFSTKDFHMRPLILKDLQPAYFQLSHILRVILREQEAVFNGTTIKALQGKLSTVGIYYAVTQKGKLEGIIYIGKQLDSQSISTEENFQILQEQLKEKSSQEEVNGPFKNIVQQTLKLHQNYRVISFREPTNLYSCFFVGNDGLQEINDDFLPYIRPKDKLNVSLSVIDMTSQSSSSTKKMSNTKQNSFCCLEWTRMQEVD